MEQFNQLEITFISYPNETLIPVYIKFSHFFLERVLCRVNVAA